MKRKPIRLSADLPLLPVRSVPETQWNFTAINTYRTCPLRYYFQYRAKLSEQPISASFVFGAAIHRAIERHFERYLGNTAKASREDLMIAYREEWLWHDRDLIEFGADERTALDLLAGRLLGAFLLHPFAKPPGRVLAVGRKIDSLVAPGLPLLAGRVDLICQKGDEVVLQSWKTSRTGWTEEQVVDEVSRLALCAEGLSKCMLGKQIHLEIFVLTKTKDRAIEGHSRPFTRQLLERGKRIVERVHRGVDAGLFFPAPSPIACSTCSFRDPCRSWPG